MAGTRADDPVLSPLQQALRAEHGSPQGGQGKLLARGTVGDAPPLVQKGTSLAGDAWIPASAGMALKTRLLDNRWRLLGAYAGLLKSRVVALLLVVALVTAVVASDGQIAATKLLLLAVSGGLAASGAATLNHYADRDIDAVMGRTRKRPLPSGAVRPLTVLVLGLALVGLGILASLPLGVRTTFFLALGAVIYLPVYTLWLKRRTALNIVIGGGAGSCAALAGWASAGGGHLMETSLLAALVFLWTPSHFWSYAVVHREDYEQVCVPMLPVKVSAGWATALILAHSALVVALAVALAYPLRAFGGIYAAGAGASSLLPMWAGWRLLRHPGRDSAYFNFKASGAYLGLVFLFILADVLV